MKTWYFKGNAEQKKKKEKVLGPAKTDTFWRKGKLQNYILMSPRIYRTFAYKIKSS